MASEQATPVDSIKDEKNIVAFLVGGDASWFRVVLKIRWPTSLSQGQTDMQAFMFVLFPFSSPFSKMGFFYIVT